MTEEGFGRFTRLLSVGVCDANGKSGNMNRALNPIDHKSKLTGPAVTARSQPGDNLTIFKATYEAEQYPYFMLLMSRAIQKQDHLEIIRLRIAGQEVLPGLF